MNYSHNKSSLQLLLEVADFTFSFFDLLFPLLEVIVCVFPLIESRQAFFMRRLYGPLSVCTSDGSLMTYRKEQPEYAGA